MNIKHSTSLRGMITGWYWPKYSKEHSHGAYELDCSYSTYYASIAKYNGIPKRVPAFLKKLDLI